MSAKYTCDVCSKKLPHHYNTFKEHEFVDNDIRVCFIVDFNQQVENDICIPCALEAINIAAKKLWKGTK
ncbi:MAG TPA: hypothetical protein ENH82_16690 [bacterium]|nr:hypothetical protein [bacterium]